MEGLDEVRFVSRGVDERACGDVEVLGLLGDLVELVPGVDHDPRVVLAVEGIVHPSQGDCSGVVLQSLVEAQQPVAIGDPFDVEGAVGTGAREGRHFGVLGHHEFALA